MQLRPAVFLDKDGTLIEDVPFNVEPGRITLTPGAGEALSLLEAAGFALVLVSNQPGVALGRFPASALAAVDRRLARLLAPHGVALDAAYYCPHAPAPGAGRLPACACRKPAPGLIFRAAREHRLDLQRSWMVGDILNDVEAGRAAGCRTVLVDNGGETEWKLSPARMPHFTVPALLEAARLIVAAQPREAAGTRLAPGTAGERA